MLLHHAAVLAAARSYIAALADQARTFEGSMEYERALILLDSFHPGSAPTVSRVPVRDSVSMFAIAWHAVAGLGEHGVDRLALELCLATLDAARHTDCYADIGTDCGTDCGTALGTAETELWTWAHIP